MLAMDRRRAFGCSMVLAALAYFVLQLCGMFQVLLEREGDALMTFEMYGSMGLVAPMLPLIAALAYSLGFCQDLGSGYVTLASLRCTKRRYLLSKIVACALSGGLAVALGTLLVVLILNLRFPPDVSSPMVEEAASDLIGLLKAPGFGPLLLYYLARVALQFLAGMFWACSALAFSAFYPSAPLTLCAPLVLYRLMLELSSLLRLPAYLNVTWLDDGQVGLPPAQTLLCGLLVFGALALLSALLFYWRAGRRLSYA